jgi:NAD(P)-dependent dehydrogenase (short-subunit alcohol dehydrogenase family)
MSTSLLGLEGKAFLILGGGQGMGEASAHFLARAGADVALADLEASRAEAVAESARGLGRRAVPVVGDVLDDTQIARIVAEAAAGLGRLDGMVAIVGAAHFQSLFDMTAETWDHEFRRNLRYVFLSAREVAQTLIRAARPGALVAIASVDGLQGSPLHAAYGAAKAGLINLVQSMAVEWAPHGIRVNAIAPGHIVTPRLYDTPARQEWYRTSLIPAGRRGSTDDIGKAVTFLLSDLAAYVTGITLPVDGGLLAANRVNSGMMFRNTSRDG